MRLGVYIPVLERLAVGGALHSAPWAPDSTPGGGQNHQPSPSPLTYGSAARRKGGTEDLETSQCFHAKQLT